MRLRQINDAPNWGIGLRDEYLREPARSLEKLPSLLENIIMTDVTPLDTRLTDWHSSGRNAGLPLSYAPA